MNRASRYSDTKLTREGIVPLALNRNAKLTTHHATCGFQLRKNLFCQIHRDCKTNPRRLSGTAGNGCIDTNHFTAQIQ